MKKIIFIFLILVNFIAFSDEILKNKNGYIFILKTESPTNWTEFVDENSYNKMAGGFKNFQIPLTQAEYSKLKEEVLKLKENEFGTIEILYKNERYQKLVGINTKKRKCSLNFFLSPEKKIYFNLKLNENQSVKTKDGHDEMLSIFSNYADLREYNGGIDYNKENGIPVELP